MLLDELLARLTELSEKSRTEAIDLAVQSTATMAWVPNPGPQTQAFLCEADELFYGGEAGAGGRALTRQLAPSGNEILILERGDWLNPRGAELGCGGLRAQPVHL